MSKPTKMNVSIQKPVYTMAATDGQSAEVVMYGDIYEEQPRDWWGDPIEGQFILLSEFLEDLKEISGCKDITIRMHSYGGDAGAANTIHNRLRELARGGAKLTCIVDGVAMSGGSLIMCACDTVKVNPSSLIMIHKAWAFFWGGYNADDLREQATSMDAYDKMQVEVYKRKCGLSNTVILHMMADTTYMTGREAVEKGFADEVIEDAEPMNIAASADGRSLFVRGRQMHLAPGMFAPDTIPTVTPEASATVETNTQPAQSGEPEGGRSMNLKEFREQHPEAAAELEAEVRAAVEGDSGHATPSGPAATPPAPSTGADDTIQAERKRIQDIDDVAHLFPDDVVEAAKYGEHPCTAQEMSYRAALAASKNGTKFLAALDKDTDESGAGGIGAADGAGGDGGEDTPQAMAAQAKKDAAAFNQRKKEVR